MLSAKMFEQVGEICSIKDPSKLFGGIQVIVSGDFFQLPPVPNTDYNDEGTMCFTSQLFERILPHKIVLNQVVRQDNKLFINAIHEVSKGTISPETVSFVKSLDRPLPVGLSKSVLLFSNNELVNVFNRREILKGPGQIREFISVDSGDKRALFKSIAAPRLWLKEGCPVILIRNISNTLVNGLKGTVVGFEEDCPVVRFPSINCTTNIKKVSFTVFSPNKNTTVATRVQVPLKLAFAITIHKAQGMTLDSVTVDCQQIFKPGQLGVAMGRVRCPESLRVVNFHPSVCLSHPDDIDAFVSQKSEDLDQSLICCRHHKRTKDDKLDILVTGDDEYSEMFDVDDNVFDEELDRVLAEINLQETDVNFQLPEAFCINDVLYECIYENPLTPMQKEMNDALNQLMQGDKLKLLEFCKKEFKVIGKFVNDMDIHEPSPVKAETMTEFYRKCHVHQTSDSYRVSCSILFQDCNRVCNSHSHICFKITTAVRNFLLKEKSKLFPLSTHQSAARSVTDASKARIRYVGGYCLSKVTQKYLRLQRSRMFLLTAEKQLEFDDAAEKVNVLNSLREEENYLKQVTSVPDSLLDVTRKQNLNRGLYHIPDDLFEFFVNLSENCITLLNENNFHAHGENLHSYCKAEISECLNLFDKFVTVVRGRKSTNILFNDVNDTPTSLIRILFDEIVHLFLMVLFNQFKKDMIQTFSVTKTMAHRKQIQIKKQKTESTSVKPVTFSTIQNDITEIRKMSHSMLQGLILSKVDIFNAMTKVQIQQLLQAYNVKFKSSSTKSALIKDIEKAILGCDSMPNPTVLDKSDSRLPRNIVTATQIITEAEESPTGSSLFSVHSDKKTDPPGDTESHQSTSTSHDYTEPQTSTSGFCVSNQSQLSTSCAMEDTDDDELCKVCFKGEIGTDWICCTNCDCWLHRTCTKIKTNTEWKKLSRPNAKFFCSDCS